MLNAVTRHDIQVLRSAGVTQEKVADVTGTSLRSVRRVENEPPVTLEEPGAGTARAGRPSKAAPFRSFVVEVLKAEPELMSLEILRRARHKGYTGRKSALYALIAKHRPPKQKPVVRFEGLPGEFSQHDFGQVDVRFLDGSVRRVHFFASRLKYSRFSQVTIVPNQGVESLARTLGCFLNIFCVGQHLHICPGLNAQTVFVLFAGVNFSDRRNGWGSGPFLRRRLRPSLAVWSWTAGFRSDPDERSYYLQHLWLM